MERKRSPAKRFRDQKLASLSGTEAETPAQKSQKDLMLIMFHNHYKTLKSIKSIAAKIAKKIEILPEYDGYVEGVLESATGDQDQVLVNIMIWKIDVGDFHGALDIAAYAIEHDLNAPDRFNRDTIDIIIEQIAESVIRTKTPGDVGIMEQALALATGLDVLDQVMMKMHKALGMSYHDIDKNKALSHYEMSNDFGSICGEASGLSKIIPALKKEIKKEEPEPKTPPPAQEQKTNEAPAE